MAIIKGVNERLLDQLHIELNYNLGSKNGKAKTLIQLAYDLSGSSMGFNPEDGQFLATWILAHTRANGATMRRILTDIMETV